MQNLVIMQNSAALVIVHATLCTESRHGVWTACFWNTQAGSECTVMQCFTNLVQQREGLSLSLFAVTLLPLPASLAAELPVCVCNHLSS